MAVPVKIDQVELGLERLISQWQDKPNVVGLLRSYLQQVNELEDIYFQLLEERGIHDAIGVQLDNIGALFDVARLGRNDPDYRAAILLKVSQLNDDGTTEVFMQALRTAGNTDIVDFWEHPSGDVHAYMGAGFNTKTYSQLENAVPAGVNVRIMVDDRRDSFVMTELTPLASDLQVVDNVPTTSDLQVNDGSVVSDLQIQAFNPQFTPRGYLPEIQDTTVINPLADIIDRDSFSFTGELVLDNGDSLVDENDNQLLWTDFRFTN